MLIISVLFVISFKASYSQVNVKGCDSLYADDLIFNVINVRCNRKIEYNLYGTVTIAEKITIKDSLYIYPKSESEKFVKKKRKYCCYIVNDTNNFYRNILLTEIENYIKLIKSYSEATNIGTTGNIIKRESNYILYFNNRTYENENIPNFVIYKNGKLYCFEAKKKKHRIKQPFDLIGSIKVKINDEFESIGGKGMTISEFENFISTILDR